MNSTATRNLQKLSLYVYQAFAMHVFHARIQDYLVLIFTFWFTVS